MDRPCIAGSLCSLVTAPALSSRDMLITSVDAASTFEELCEEVRDMCSLRQGQPLTLKWVDSEGSPQSPAVRGAAQSLSGAESFVPVAQPLPWGDVRPRD